MFKKLTHQAAIVFIVFSSVAAIAADFDPVSKPIKVIIPYAVGGGTSNLLTVIQQYAIKSNITLVPEFRPGASATIGIDAAVAQPPDGYTVLITGTDDVLNTSIPHKFTTDDLYPVTAIAKNVLLLVSSKTSKVTSLNQLTHIMKADPRKLSWGVASPSFAAATNTLAHNAGMSDSVFTVPFNGAGPVLRYIISGHVDLALLPGSVVKSAVDSGLVNVIAEISDPGQTKVNVAGATQRVNSNNNGYSMFISANAPTNVKLFWEEFMSGFATNRAAQTQLQAMYMSTMPSGHTYVKHILSKALNE